MNIKIKGKGQSFRRSVFLGLRALETELPQLKQASTEQAEKLASKTAELQQRLEDEVQRLAKRLEVNW